jgi:hypothetical protein
MFFGLAGWTLIASEPPKLQYAYSIDFPGYVISFRLPKVFSIPIDRKRFVDVGIDISEWVPGSSQKWMPRAEELNDAILSSVVISPR